jgi:hypothetical protein
MFELCGDSFGCQRVTTSESFCGVHFYSMSQAFISRMPLDMKS